VGCCESAKKNPLSAGADNGFRAYFECLRLRHYQPPVPVAENDLDYEENNKANKVDGGEKAVHAVLPVKISPTLTAAWGNVKQISAH
jgi:hypothetical protein